MERESFEDEEVAEVLNEHFICIKVDREERPDVDHIYMSFCQALTGHGGWPLSIFMTADKKPFYAGTYFPKYSKYGHPGLMEVLEKITDAWDRRRSEILKSSESIQQAVAESMMNRVQAELSRDVIDDTYQELKELFDPTYGGFGSAPKFPTPHNLSFLLRYFQTTGKKDALDIVEKTLNGMYRGGIYDHVGFGFSRYSTDEKWLVPHFEKMLYDNALLAITYLEAYQLTGNIRYADVANKVLTYILRDMRSLEGGFYSAEDADSEGVEGKFYVWDRHEVMDILGKEDGELYCRYYDIKDGGNFEGKSIPHLIKVDIDEVNENEELEERLNKCRDKLFEYRAKRIYPHKDDKILTSWNGLMIAAMAYAGRVVNNVAYVHAAKEAIGFIFKKLVREDGRLLARYRDGEAAYPAYIDDYAFLVWGLIELYETTFETIYLEKAVDVTNDMVYYFWDEQEGGFYIYGKDSEELLVRPKELYDGATPSGNSVATLNLLRLARLTGDKSFEEKAQMQFQHFGGMVDQNPNGYTHFLMAFLFANIPTQEIVITGDPKDENATKIKAEINKRFLPYSTVIFNSGNEKLHNLVPHLKNLSMLNQKTTMHICENFTCHEPINDINQVIKMLDARKVMV